MVAFKILCPHYDNINSTQDCIQIIFGFFDHLWTFCNSWNHLENLTIPYHLDKIFLGPCSRLIVSLVIPRIEFWFSSLQVFIEVNVWKFVVDTTTECQSFFTLWNVIYSFCDVLTSFPRKILMLRNSEKQTTVSLQIILDLYHITDRLD